MLLLMLADRSENDLGIPQKILSVLFTLLREKKSTLLSRSSCGDSFSFSLFDREKKLRSIWLIAIQEDSDTHIYVFSANGLPSCRVLNFWMIRKYTAFTQSKTRKKYSINDNSHIKHTHTPTHQLNEMSKDLPDIYIFSYDSFNFIFSRM